MDNSLLRIVKKICFIIGGISLTFMFSLVTAEVINRRFFHSSFLIVDEVIAYLMLPIVFFGGVIALDEDKFVRVSAFYDQFKPKLKWILEIVFCILFAAYNGMLTYYCYESMMMDYQFGAVSATTLQMPLWIPKTFMVVGLAILEIYLIARIIATVRGKGKEDKI